MAELIVVGFKKDMSRASEVLNTLMEMNTNWVVDLNDAVAVYRDYGGKLRVDQSYQMTTGEGAAWDSMKQSLTPDSSALVVVLNDRWVKDLERDLNQAHARAVIANEIASK